MKRVAMAQEFWCVARRKTDSYLKITRGMTTLPHAKRTSQFYLVQSGNGIMCENRRMRTILSP
jgi:hypothetical protein